MNVLITIPARAGSKGLKNKNMRELAGVPLLAHTLLITEKLNTNYIITGDIDDFIPYNYLGMRHHRLAELCTDTALAWDVWQDAVKAAESHFNRTWDIHLYLEPTSPCRTEEDIQKCIDLIQSGKESVCTISKAPTPEKFIQIDENKIFCMDFDGFLNNKPRQLYPDNWYRKNGICYACTDKRMKSATTMLDPTTHFLIIKRLVVNIDSEEDFFIAEILLNKEDKL